MNGQCGHKHIAGAAALDADAAKVAAAAAAKVAAAAAAEADAAAAAAAADAAWYESSECRCCGVDDAAVCMAVAPWCACERGCGCGCNGVAQGACIGARIGDKCVGKGDANGAGAAECTYAGPKASSARFFHA